jgi:orotidine-5'-phosphate decarboxylase
LLWGCDPPPPPPPPPPRLLREQSLSAVNFADRLDAVVAERESQIALGLDPDPARLLPEAVSGASALSGSVAERAGRAVALHCRALIDAAGPACAAVKVQLACFERLGAPGWAALAEVCEAGRAAGLMVIADGKRGDVPHTAAAYAQALIGETPTAFGEVAGLRADAVTLNPLLGRDALEPFVESARARGSGTFVLVRTSNEGAAEIQDEAPAGGAPLRERLARIVDALGAGGVGASGLSDVGAVVAATEPALLANLRDAMPRAVFLLPGVGAQGGRAELLGPAFAPGRASALIAASRSIAGPALEAGSAEAARSAAEALREVAWGVSSPGH